MPEDWITTAGLALTTLISIAATWRAVRRLRRGGVGRWSERGVALAAALLAIGLLGYRMVVVRQSWEPLGSHVDGVLLLLALLGGIVAYLQVTGRLSGMGAFALPGMVVLGAWGFCASWWTFRPFDIQSVWEAVHVIGAYFTAAAVLIAAACGGLYLMVQRLLKSRSKLSVLGRAASLESIEKWLLGWSTMGLIALTVMMAVGIVDATSQANPLGPNWWGEPKVIGAAVVWVLYGLICHGRWAAALRGKPAAILAIAGLGVLLAVLAMTL